MSSDQKQDDPSKQVSVCAMLGWFAGRAIWRRRGAEREEQLHRAFGEILALAGSGPRQLVEAEVDDDHEDVG